MVVRNSHYINLVYNSLPIMWYYFCIFEFTKLEKFLELMYIRN